MKSLLLLAIGCILIAAFFFYRTWQWTKKEDLNHIQVKSFTYWGFFLVLALMLCGVFFASKSQAADIVLPGEDLPNPVLTQGANAVDSAGVNIGTRPVTVKDLCPHANTKTIRNVTEAEKNQLYKNYGLKQIHDPRCTGPGKACYEADHECSLELGCSNVIQNVWPQRYDGTPWNAHVKDKLENELHSRICSGQLTIQEAQQCISSNWIECYKKTFPNAN